MTNPQPQCPGQRRLSLGGLLQAICITVFVVLLSTPYPAHAILVGGGAFDWLLSEAHVIVKVRVTEMKDASFEEIEFSGEVVSTLKRDGGAIPEEQTFRAAFPVWPDDLGWEYRQGKVILLCLRRTTNGLEIINNRHAILPASKEYLFDIGKRSAEQNIFLELKPVLEKATAPRAKALLLVLLSHVATPDHLEVFAKYQASRDSWMRSAAFASLARLDPQPSRVSPIVHDFTIHLENPEKDHEFLEVYRDIKLAARCGSFGYSEPLTSRAKMYLPVYRAIVDTAPPEYSGIYIGVTGLKNVGTSEDLLRLYKFRNHERDWLRHDALEGLSRILGKSPKKPRITAYGPPLSAEVILWEKTILADIGQILKDQGLIRDE